MPAGDRRPPRSRYATSAERFVGDDPASTLRIFTRKEAILKARGTGFRVDPRQQPTAGIAIADGWTVTGDGWWLFEPSVPGVLMCLAARVPEKVRLDIVDLGGDRAASSSDLPWPTELCR